jgi:glycosyltransferase involved in cell wall biosynthesis
MSIAFVLLSYAEGEPAGMERSVAALVEGLTALGNKAYILAAGPLRVEDSASIVRLRSLAIRFPATDECLVAAIRGCGRELTQEIENFIAAYNIEIICWVDALWGLGFLPRLESAPRSILMVHVVPPGNIWLETALSAGHDEVIAPSRFVCSVAENLGIPTEKWRIVPNALMGANALNSTLEDRQELLKLGPIRLAARLGGEKGILPLIECKPSDFTRTVEVALGHASFEARLGSQSELWRKCAEAAQLKKVRILPVIPWQGVPSFFAGASVGIVPSLAETFGLVALECMSVGTPVVAFSVGNLPELIGDGGIIVDPQDGFEALWKATSDLLDSPDKYQDLSQKGILRAKDLSSTEVAKLWLRIASL